MWPVRVHVVSKLCHNEEWFNLSQQISRLNKKYILTQVCCNEYDQKKKCYAIMLSLKMVHTLILGRGNVENSFPVLCRFYSVLAHARSSWVILKLIFFKFQGPLPHTANHFWQMIWEQNTAAIIMLNKVVEKNQASTNLIIDFYI